MIGRDPRRWHTGVPAYARVTYRGVWPGIDVSFYGNQRTLEYDVRVSAGADPRRVAIRLDGARDVRLNAHGDLLIALHSGTVRQLAPHAYQVVGHRRAAVASRFVLLGGDRVAVRLGAYDHRRSLVIDPALIYATYLGGSGNDFTNPETTVDSAGNLYVTGPTLSTDFPITPGAYQTTYGGGTDAYVAKVNATGTAFVYSTYLGGSGTDAGNGVAVNSAGDAYVVGLTASTNFPVTSGAFQTTNGGGQDGFVAELNPTGSGLVFSTYLGGSGTDTTAKVALDASGDVYVTGFGGSPNFPTTPGAFQTANAGGIDSYVAKFNRSGSALIYSTLLGGSGDDSAHGLAVDSGGSAYVAGTTTSTDFPTTPGAFQRTYGGGTGNAFLAKIDPTGTALTYATYLGGSGNDTGTEVALDSTGSAYVIGSTSSTNFPTTRSGYQATYGGGTSDAFLAKFNPAGSALEYSTYLGGSGSDAPGGVAVDAGGSAYVAGTTASTDFPTTPGAFQTANAGGTEDAFLTKFNPAGSALVYSTYLGGNSFDVGNGLTIDASGNAYVSGSTSSTNFPITPGAAQATLGGAIDGYVVKLAPPTYLRSTSTSIACSPAAAVVGAATTCTATVTDTDAGPVSAPSGVVSFASSGSGAFAPGAACTLAGTTTAGQAACQVSYVPETVGSGAHAITADYGGDGGHATSQGSTTLAVTAPGISVTTAAASDVTAGSAVLHGVIGTGGVARSWQFQYGRTTIYGSGTPIQTTPAGKGAVSVSWTVKRLRPLTRYHFRLVGLTGTGASVKSVYGRDVTFTTKATGRLLLDAVKLLVTRGVVSPVFSCASSVRCASKLSITTRARLGKGKKLATVVCATTRRFFNIRAHKRLKVKVGVRSACLTLMRAARHGSIAAQLTANPDTGQHAVIRKVSLRM